MSGTNLVPLFSKEGSGEILTTLNVIEPAFLAEAPGRKLPTAAEEVRPRFS